MTHPRYLVSAVAVGGTLLLSGCASQGVSIPAGADELTRCAPKVIESSAVAALGQPGCNLAGSTIVFTDGTSLSVPEVGSVFSQETPGSGNSYLLVNWGVPGVGVAFVRNGILDEVWASSPDAEELQRAQLEVEGVRSR